MGGNNNNEYIDWTKEILMQYQVDAEHSTLGQDGLDDFYLVGGMEQRVLSKCHNISSYDGYKLRRKKYRLDLKQYFHKLTKRCNERPELNMETKRTLSLDSENRQSRRRSQGLCNNLQCMLWKYD
ncbi:hypothetical protein Tco_0190255 [Tanacetum coccineum]